MDGTASQQPHTSRKFKLQARRNSNQGQKACERCRTLKIKCPGGDPCRSCQQARKPVQCVYVSREQKVTVSESYLRDLQDQLRAYKLAAETEALSHESTQTQSPMAVPEAQVMHDVSVHPSEAGGHFINFISDEALIQPRFLGEASSETFGGRLHQYMNNDDRVPPARSYIYYDNPKLLRMSSTNCQLPNKNYAKLLVRAVLRFVGGDHYLLTRKSFLKRLELTYQLETLDDSVWLCRLFTVFALGELYSARMTTGLKTPRAPGTAFFMIAMGYFQDMYEKPSVAYVETLLLLSFYLVALNRRNTAYTYSGLALRCCLTLGLHRKIPDTMPAAEREHRVRVWWTCYALDRIYTSKVGLPMMLRDSDIDVQMPSMDGLSTEEAEDFYSPELMTAQIKLARITGNIMCDLYRIPQPGKGNTFVQSVQKILNNLRQWHETLPSVLRLNFNAMPIYPSRSVASLHLHFGNAVILTTRPILFYVFRMRTSTNKLSVQEPVSPITSALVEACVQAARTSNSILAQLWVDGCLASYGFFDALSVFTSTMILMLSSAFLIQNSNDEDAVETAWSLIRSMKDVGNLPICSYHDQLIELKADLEKMRLNRTRGHTHPSSLPSPIPDEHGETSKNTRTATVDFSSPGLETFDNDMVFGLGDDMGAILDGPFLQDFLQQSADAWATGSVTNIADGNAHGVNTQFDWDQANLFGDFNNM